MVYIIIIYILLRLIIDTMHSQQCMGSLWAYSVQILVILNPTGYMLTSSGFAYSFEVYSLNSSEMIGNSPEVSNFNWIFLKTHPVHL